MQQIVLLFVFILFYGCNNTSDSSVTTLESNTTTTPEPLYYQQWAVDYNESFFTENGISSNAHIHPSTYYDTYTGKGVKVAIIDSGFDIEHIEIKNQIVKTYNPLNKGTNVAHSGDDYHGSAVTGVIASAQNGQGLRGIAPHVELLLIKFPSQMEDSHVIDMFTVAKEWGADIISNSWGTGQVSQTVKDALMEIAQSGRNGKGLPIVFASGNDGGLMDTDESAIPYIIGVGATDKENYRTTYSNYGKELDVVAPAGEQIGITTIDPMGDAGLSYGDYLTYNAIDEKNTIYSAFFSGTSAAAPIVTGVLALVIEKNPNITLDEITELIKSTSDKIGLNTPYIDALEVFGTTTPTITGSLGSSGKSDFVLKIYKNDVLVHSSEIGVQGDGWEVQITTPLDEGEYTAKLISSEQVWATEESFIIDTAQTTQTSSQKRRSDFYGYGKINITNFLEAM
jgi:subtilisin family serine protease